MVADLTDSVVDALLRRQPQGGTFHIEDIQDQVELALMRSGEHDVARAYVLYREERAKARAQREDRAQGQPNSTWSRAAAASRSTATRLQRLVESACEGLADAEPGARSSKPRCATCTTACRWRRCASPRCWPRAR